MKDDLKVDICCGETKPEGFIGVDIVDGPNVDVVGNLNDKFPFDDDALSYLRAYDAIEHLGDKINTMNEIWRVCKTGATVEIFVPSTDGRGAFQDPTHVSYWNANSFMYYSIDHLSYLKLCKKYGFKGSFKIKKIEHTNSPMNIIHVYVVLEVIK